MTILEFIEEAPGELAECATLLSCAIAHTEYTSSALLENFGKSLTNLRYLKACDFVLVSNGQWRFKQRERIDLLRRLANDRESFVRANTLMLALNTGEGSLPEYLLTAAGQAYHHCNLSPKEGLEAYRRTFSTGNAGQQWLTAKFSEEQQEVGILSASIDLLYFRGMVAYREGRVAEAERCLRRVAQSNAYSVEVGIAKHVYGNILRRKNHRNKDAGLLLRSAYQMLSDLGEINSVGLVALSLAVYTGEDNLAESEKLLREAMAVGEEYGNDSLYFNAAMKLSGLLGRYRGEKPDARRFLEGVVRRAKMRSYARLPQVLYSFALLFGEGEEREQLHALKDALEAAEMYSDSYTEARALHTMAVNETESNPVMAEQHFKRSLAIGEREGYAEHVAHVQHSIGNFYAKQGRITEASDLLQKAISSFENINKLESAARVRNTLGSVLLDAGEVGEAVRQFSLVLQSTQNFVSSAHAHYKIACVLTSSDPKEAANHISQALRLAKRANRPDLLRIYRELQAQIRRSDAK